MPGVHTQLLALDELYLAVPRNGRNARGGDTDGPIRLADLADVPWVLDPPTTEPGQWLRTFLRGAGFEPDIRFVSTDLLLQVHLVETGHAAAVLPGLLLTDRTMDVRLSRMPGRPHRRLLTGMRAGAAGHPAVRAFRAALRQGIRHGAEEAAAGGAPS
jgi:DNA-binding transcriptional LysR family regulator